MSVLKFGGCRDVHKGCHSWRTSVYSDISVLAKLKIKPKKKRGFALVLALSLMSFMVLLITSLAVMVSMQTKLSKISLNNFKAKQAAKFAAYQALGQIQSTLGPDQRITANASILSQNIHSGITNLDTSSSFDWWSSPMNITRNDAEAISADISPNKYWVGVWNSKRGYSPEKQLRNETRSGYVQNIMDKAMTWLVSGNGIATEDEILKGETTSSVKYRPNESLDEKNFIKLVGKNSFSRIDGNNQPSDYVFAPIVNLDSDNLEDEVGQRGNIQTRIAWWVSDEGQKASLNAIASFEARKHSESIKYRIQSLPFYSGIQGLTIGDSNSKMYNISLRDDGVSSSSMMIARNASSLEQLDVIASDELSIPSKILFHSATCDSKGLLVNVRDGGLKKDLSLGLLQLDGKDDANAQTTQKEIEQMPDYFPRPYGVSGYFRKTTAYPIRFLDSSKPWRMNRRGSKPELNDSKYIGKRREFAGHIFGPQMFTREDEVEQYPKMSFGTANAASDWKFVFSDNMLLKDPGGALWDQLRSYYNLRSPAAPKQSNISARVQTDDRYGAKPVVKRFTVHYVPSLVDYGNENYGVRLHIVPMLVLWNPYDTKIGEDAHYVIRVSSRDSAAMRNPIGVYRFAIGYESNGYFQSLRDLFTERMRYNNAELEVGNIDFIKRNGFTVSQYGFVGSNYSGENLSSYTNPKSEGISNSSIGGRINPYLWLSGSSEGFPDYRSSRSTPYYLRQISGKFSVWMPFGYGSIARNYITAVSRTTIAGINPNLYRQNSVFPTKRKTSSQDLNERASDNSDWQSVITEDNMWPKATELAKWKLSASAKTIGQADVKGYARIAKIPLYLNNLYASVAHGGYNTRIKKGSDDYMFYPQRGIDAINHSTVYSEHRGWGEQWPVDLHFMAYDPTGINPGATKIFVMNNIVNYLGNHKTRDNSNGTDGPNGVIEDMDLAGDQSPYERKEALMLPVGEGSKNWGGCFYLDVPHPELEHYSKYDNDRPRPKLTTFNANPDAVVSSTEELDNPYILFNLNHIRAANTIDVNGKSSSSLTKSDILVDMQDVSVFSPVDYTAGRYTPLEMNIAMTPMCYGLSRYGSANSTAHGPTASNYAELQLSIWIYKKEGITFTKMRPREKYEMWWGGEYPDYIPLLVNIRGRRNFMGTAYPSFPDPAMDYMPEGYSKEGGQFNNWHTAGFVSSVSSGSGVANRNKLISLEPPTFYRQLDNYVSEKSAVLTSALSQDGDFASNWTNIDLSAKQAFNGRYFLNWLPLNPRRHSANFWKMRSSLTSDRNQIGDMTPIAVEVGRGFIVSRSDASSNQYQSLLNSYIHNEGGSKFMPYGFVFAIPYADTQGAEPIHNRRLFVNGSLLATTIGTDYNAQEVTGDSKMNQYARRWGLSNKAVIATSVVYNGNNDSWDGLSDVGYKIPGPSDSSAYIGLSSQNGTDVSSTHHILREDEVVHNVANLSSANLTFGSGKMEAAVDNMSLTGAGAIADSALPWNYSYGINPPESLMSSLAIGNSLCPSRITPEFTFQTTWVDGSSTVSNYAHTKGEGYGVVDGSRTRYEEKSVIYDLSWHFNDALWDEYFFSTLPYRLKESQNAYQLPTGEVAPQNPRIEYISSKVALNPSDLKYSEDVSDVQFEDNASKVWINGPFNVNSTSVDAWKTILSTYYGQEIEGYQEGVSDNESSVPFHRWHAPLNASGKVTSNTSISDENAIFTGYRALSNEEIEELASSIVEHIKDRGPFYSMSDFVNRLVANYSAEEKYARKNAGEESLLILTNQNKKQIENQRWSALMEDGGESYRVGHMQKGVLQAAIDATSINSQLHTRFIIGTDVSSLSSTWENSFSKFKDEKKVWENWRAVVGPISTGAPAYLMQQDILSRLGSFLTVRSDTFKIRAYGEIRNPVSGIVESRAWCEMTVQRTPEYIDNSEFGNIPTDVFGREKELGHQPDMPEFNTVFNSANGGLTKLNKQLGRRFKIVSFRWLGNNEI